MIKLTDKTGDIYINPAHIVYLYRSSRINTTITMVDDTPIYVKETVESILKLIKEEI